MRIIGGKYRSRKVYSVTEPVNCIKTGLSGFRPTTDRARESLFNILNNLIDFEGTVCADLFAGSGAIGFELLSRGAVQVDFAENSNKQINLLKRTANELGCENEIKIFDENVLSFLSRNDKYYDIIFADPPYAYEHYDELIAGVLKRDFSIFVIEHSGNISHTDNSGKYEIIKRNTGAAHFIIFNRIEA